MNKSVKAFGKILMIVVGAAMTFAPGTILAKGEITGTSVKDASGIASVTGDQSDTLAMALATFWGNPKMVEGYDAAQREQFIAALTSVLADTASTESPTEKGVNYGAYLRTGLSQMADLGMTANREVFTATLVKVLRGGNSGFSIDEAAAYINSLAGSDAELDPADFTPEKQAEFIAAAMKEDGAVTTPSGLVFCVLSEGEGEFPTDADRVELEYVGRLSDGTVFDETERPVNFNLVNLVDGLSEGLKMMRPGGRYRLVIPASIGYGDKGIEGAIPPGAALDFIIDLIGVDRGANLSK